MLGLMWTCWFGLVNWVWWSRESRQRSILIANLYIIWDSNLFRIILTVLPHYRPITAFLIIQTHTPSTRIAEQVALLIEIVPRLIPNFEFGTNPFRPPSLELLVTIAFALRHARMGCRPSCLFAMFTFYLGCFLVASCFCGATGCATAEWRQW